MILLWGGKKKLKGTVSKKHSTGPQDAGSRESTREVIDDRFYNAITVYRWKKFFIFFKELT